jgi:hypothetical protein
MMQHVAEHHGLKGSIGERQSLPVEARHGNLRSRTLENINTLNGQIPPTLQDQGGDQPIAGPNVEHRVIGWNEIREMIGQHGGSTRVDGDPMPRAERFQKVIHDPA